MSKFWLPWNGRHGVDYLQLLDIHLLGFLRVSNRCRKKWAKNNKSIVNNDEQWGMRQFQLSRTEIFVKNAEHPICSPAALALAIYIKTKTKTKTAVFEDP
jgi:hypothetical protein